MRAMYEKGPKEYFSQNGKHSRGSQQFTQWSTVVPSLTCINYSYMNAI